MDPPQYEIEIKEYGQGTQQTLPLYSGPPQPQPQQAYVSPPSQVGYPPASHSGYPPQTYPLQPQPQPAYIPPQAYSAPPPSYAPQTSYSQIDPPNYSSNSQRFSTTPQFHNVWATILFIIHLLGMAVLAFFTMSDQTPNEFINPHDQAIFVYILIVVSGVSAFLGFIYSYGMKTQAQVMIVFSLIAEIAILCVIAAFCWYSYSLGYGILLFMFALLQILWFYLVRSRIPFAALTLETVVKLIYSYPSTLFLSFIAVLIYIGLTIFFIFFVSSAVNAWSGGALFGVLVYGAFSYYWTSQVIKNILHTTIAGFYATIYFLNGSNNFPTSPVGQSLSRSLTFSFGPICFGSLIVALVQTIRFIIRMIFDNRYLRCLADCIFGIIERILRYFNHYAYTLIAIYGYGFCQAGKETFRLFSHHGLTILINDDLIDTVLNVAVFLSGLIGCCIAYGWGVFTMDESSSTAFAVGGSFIVGVMVMICVTDIVSSGTSALVVCLAEDPSILQRTNPELANKIKQTYNGITF